MNGKYNKLVYLFFRLLFSKDIWCIFFGVGIAVILAPEVYQTRENIGIVGKIVVWIMIMTLGWATSVLPADKISKKLQNYIKNLHKNSVL